MQFENDPLRDRLLARATKPVDAAQYRASVSQMIEKSRKRIKLERMAVTAFWIFCAVSATVRLWFSGDWSHVSRSPFLACILMIWGGVEVVKHYINSCRVDLLIEIKQLQLQVYELERPNPARPPAA
jgi:hypothetical protein